jgi:hypothetical protein
LEKNFEDVHEQMNTIKIFMNMVIHDMRNPTGSIEFGVQESLQKLQDFCSQVDEMKAIFDRLLLSEQEMAPLELVVPEPP